MKKIYGFRKTSSSFHDAVVEIYTSCYQMHPLFKSFGLGFDLDNIDEGTLKALLIYYVRLNIPDPNDYNYPNCVRFSISPYDINFRSADGSFSIGWRYNKEELRKSKILYEFNVTLTSPRNKLISSRLNTCMQTLVNKGWEKYIIESKGYNKAKTSEEEVKEDSEDPIVEKDTSTEESAE